MSARRWILEHGGLSQVRVFTRYWLALLGEWPWSATPNLPPEVIATPRWYPFNIYNFASWARTTLMPLAVLSARRAVRPLPPDRRLDELFPDGRDKMDYRLPRRGSWLSWRRLFLLSDRVLHLYQKIGFTPAREIAINACLGWIVRHQDADGAWGGIQPPWIYSLMALNVEGYHARSSGDGEGPRGARLALRRTSAAERCTSRRASRRSGTRCCRCSRCRTAIATSRPACNSALDWVLANEVRYRGDWAKKVKGVEPSGWAFERANLHYPDIDDTAVALMVLARLPRALLDAPRIRATIDRALGWTLAMQSSNGGWAAFDKDNDWKIITKIPFCDFGEALDPPSADVTAHVLEALANLGFDRHHRAVKRGYEFLRSEQEADGSWFGRWGVNHIYGTAAVLPALAALGEDMSQDFVRRAADWLRAHQNEDGGWGETCASYMDDALRGRGPSTASQTAWALLALHCDRRPRPRARDPARCRVPRRDPARRWHMGRAVLHRHGLPGLRLRRTNGLSRRAHARANRARHRAAARLHAELQPLSSLFPVDGTRPRAQVLASLTVTANDGARHSTAWAIDDSNCDLPRSSSRRCALSSNRWDERSPLAPPIRTRLA